MAKVSSKSLEGETITKSEEEFSVILGSSIKTILFSRVDPSYSVPVDAIRCLAVSAEKKYSPAVGGSSQTSNKSDASA